VAFTIACFSLALPVASGNLSNHYGYQCRYGDFILNASLEATARSLSETSSIRDVGNVLFYPSNLSHLMPSPKYLTSASARSVLALARYLCFKRSASKVFFVCFTGSSFLRPDFVFRPSVAGDPQVKKHSIWPPFRHQVNSYINRSTSASPK